MAGEILKNNSNDRGVSPILAVLLLIAITLMVAGIVSIWVFSFLDEEHESGDMYLFKVDLSSADDIISITVMNGNIVKVSDFRVIVDDQDVPLGAGPLNVGEQYVMNCSFDVIKGQTYLVKIVNENKVIYIQEIIAG